MLWFCPWQGHSYYSCVLLLLHPSQWQPVLQTQHFAHEDSHYWGRRCELKTGAAGSGLGDLVGGTFPLKFVA